MRTTTIVCLALATLLALTSSGACGAEEAPLQNREPPSRGSVSPDYFANIDEVIGPEGPRGPAFEDAEYRQLSVPDAIAPIYSPVFAAAAASELPADELVIGLNISGDARAYPAGILYNREMVNDTVGGVPVLVTWCPLCYTALVHDRRVDGRVDTFGNQGALYKGAMTWFDHATESVWSQPLGEAIAGPRVGASLRLIPSQLTTWGKWLAAHPDSRVLVSDTPSSLYAGRRPGEDHVLGLIVDGQAMAWPYLEVLDAGSITAEIGGASVVISVDENTGAARAVTGRVAKTELPVIIVYRWAWERFYPSTKVDKEARIE